MAWRKPVQGVSQQRAKRQRATALAEQCPKCHRKGAFKVVVTPEGVLAKACKWQDCGYFEVIKVLGLSKKQHNV